MNPGGTKKWAFAIGSLIFSSPAIGADGTIYVGSEDKNLYAINPNGTKKWAYATGGKIESSPAIGADGTIYVGSNDGILYAIGGTPSCSVDPSAGPNGTISPSSAQTVAVGTIMNYTATANTGSTVDNWQLDDITKQTGGVHFSVNTGTFEAGSTHSLTVSFKPLPTVTVTPSAGPNGTISPNTTQALTIDKTLTFTAAANIGYTADNWQLDGVITQTGGAQYQLNLSAFVGNSTHTLKVSFKLLSPVTITPSAGPNGTISPNSAQTAAIFSTLTFTAAANAGYTTDTWYLDNIAEQIGGARYTLSNITVNHTVKVTFKLHTGPSPVRGDWWMFHHDAQHTGRSAFTGPSTPKEKWRFSFIPGISSPAIGADGTIYIGSYDHNLYAVNPDGTRKWAFATGDYIWSSPAIGTDGIIYFSSNDGYFYAVNPDGQKKWALHNYGGTPAIGTDGTIYTSAGGINLDALNTDGSLKWAYHPDPGYSIGSSPAIGADGTIYLCLNSSYGANSLCAINPDGTYKWGFNTWKQITSDLTIGADGTIYVGSKEGDFYAINPDGTQKWDFQIGGWIYSPPAIGTDGTIYVGVDFGNLYAINPDGTRKWISDDKIDFGDSSPIVGADGTIYGSGFDNLYAVNPNGTRKWVYDFKNGETSPSIGPDGTLYVVGDGLTALTAPVTITPSAGPNGTITPNTAQSVAIGTTLTLIAAANAWYMVDSWQLDGVTRQTGGEQYKVNTSGFVEGSTHPVKVTFKLQPIVTVTPSAGANGTISPNTAQTVTLGTNITFTAAANAGYTVDSWQLDGVITQTGGAQYLVKTGGFVAGSMHTVKAIFKLMPTTDTIIPSAGVNGTISPNTVQTVGVGLSLTFTAAADDRYTVDSWQLDGITTQLGGMQFQVKTGGFVAGSTHTVLVTFKALPTVTVTPTAGANGSIFPNTVQSVVVGRMLTLTATANVGYTTDTWYLDNIAEQLGGTLYHLSYVTANHTVKVTFKLTSTPPGPVPIHGDWWMFHHDSQHSGRSAFTGPISPSKKWAFAIGALIAGSSPAIGADGTTYIGARNGCLYAVYPNGSQRWAFQSNNAICSSPAIGTDGTIYIGSGDGNLYALKPDGTRKWAFPTGNSIDSSPAIGTDGTIYIGSEDNNLYAVTPDGTRKWAFATGDWVDSSPAIGADGTIYIGSADSNLYAVNQNGTRKWAFTTSGGIDASPTIGADGTVYIGSEDNHLYAVNPNGMRKWAFATGNYIRSSPALGTDGTIYVGSWDNKLYAITANGAQKWAFPISAIESSSPAIGVNGTIYVGSDKHYLYAINPDGTPQWVFDTGSGIESSPAIGADGTIYFGSLDYGLYAVTAPPVTLSPIAGPNGSISPNTTQSVFAGTNITFTAAANAGYTTDSWQLDGASKQTGGKQYLVKTDGFAPGSTHAVKVTFKPLTFSITPSAGPNGIIIPNSSQTVTYGSSVTFTATANTGYTTDSWTLDGTAIQNGGAQFMLKNVTANHAVTVTFKLQSFTITPSTGSNGAISPKTPQTATYGNNITFTATANANYTTDTWSLDGAAAQTGGSQYMLKNITANHAVKVTFKFCPSYQPDLAICNANDSSYLGYSVINMDGTNQTKNQSVAANVAANYLFQVKNSGNTTDTFVLTCPVSASCTGWTVQMVDIASGKDVTTAFTGSGVKVTLAMGAKGNYTLRITPSAYVCDSLRLAITAVSAGDATKKDVVKAGITVSTPAQPDLSICNAGDSLYLGGSIVNQDGSNQTKSQAASSGKIATFLFRVQNAGTSADTYTLTCPLPSLSGWTVKCLDSTGKDVTTALTGAAGSKTVSLAPGALANYTLQVTPGIAAVSSKPYALLITATSVRDATKKDAVKAVTTKP